MEPMNDPADLEPTTSVELEEELRTEPWLRAYLRRDDTDLEPARQRFEREQLAARRELRRAHINVAVRLHHNGLTTTSLEDEKRR